MRRNILFVILMLSTAFAYAQDSLSVQKATTTIPEAKNSENNIRYITFQKSVYNRNIDILSDIEKDIDYTSKDNPNELASNWFINLAGGIGAFIGEPLGCEDLFGRTRPLFHLSVGKWFSPTSGGRIAFQGFNLKNHVIEQQDYYHVHADFLLNVSNLFMKNKAEPRWQFIPFVGTGIIQNNTTHKHPFSLNYGILNHIKLHDRLSLSLELGGLTTFGDFDGAGKENKFADHLFHLSVGFNITLGKKGFSQTSRIYPNIDYDKLRQLERKNELNNKTLDQIRKILEIEGLLTCIQDELEKSGLSLSADSSSIINDLDLYYPKNDYSGLNSLKKRLSTLLQQHDKANERNDNINNFADNEESKLFTANTDTLFNTDSISNFSPENLQSNYQAYINQLLNQKECIGSPILFFFHIGTTSLTDSSQLANIDEIVRICKKYNLYLKVTGYADSATGNTTVNSVLSNQRAEYITDELTKRGIPNNSIIIKSKGGVNTYSPDEVNRCTKIEIYFKKKY